MVLTVKTLYLEQALAEHNHLIIHDIDIYGYRAPIGQPWYDLLVGWVAIDSGPGWIEVVRPLPILPQRRGPGSRLYWLLSRFVTSTCMCRFYADEYDAGRLTKNSVTDLLTRNTKVPTFFIWMLVSCVEISLVLHPVRINNS